MGIIIKPLVTEKNVSGVKNTCLKHIDIFFLREVKAVVLLAGTHDFVYDPWDLLQPQDATSRHRGAKPSRRYGLLGMISLLSPGYLLSVERCRARAPAPDHYLRLSSLLGPSSSQSSPLVRLHSTPDCQPGRADL